MIRGNISIYEMVKALNKVFERKSWDQPLESTIKRIDIPIEERMQELLDKVIFSNSRILFDDLFKVKTRSHIVLTFMALLELIKSNQIYCEQTDHFKPLYLCTYEEE